MCTVGRHFPKVLFCTFYRTLMRRHASTEDLTELKVEAKIRDEDIKEGRIFPYEERLLLEHEKEKEEKPPSMLQVLFRIQTTNFQQVSFDVFDPCVGESILRSSG